MSKADEITNRVNWKAHASKLASVLTPRHIVLLELAWEEGRKKFPVIGDFNLKNPAVQATIKGLGKRIVGIAETTRTDIRGILETALTGDGPIPSTDTIAKLIRESGATNSVSRSKLIARTESGNALNIGGLIAIEEAGVKKVEVLDGDGDDVCSEANGQIWTIEEAMANPLGHPGCTRAFAPVLP